MQALKAQIDTRSEDFRANAQRMRAVVDDLRAKAASVALGGGKAARARHTARGKLLPRERVEQLLDPARRSWKSANWRPAACTTTRRRRPG